MTETCPACRKRRKQKHANAKWCLTCANERRRSPRHGMTPAQVKLALSLRGHHQRAEVARRVGVSLASISRLGRELNLSFDGNRYPAKVYEEVCAYYAEHGRPATEKRFPGIRVRSIIEKYPHKPRQVRWTSDQIVAAARMAGLVSMERQAEIFKRPRAHAGSIRSLWMKRMKLAAGQLHGLSKWSAREILRPGFPTIRTEWWNVRDTRRGDTSRSIVLWCDMEPWLLPGIPKFMRDGIRAMAQFQRWLFGTDDPRRAIMAMMRRARKVAA